tara:strand:+ start:8401 stop:9225 length:825 start_codon:yes stop_codon:yes gene_type:complete
MPDLDRSQFIVGTSAWGSRITVRAAIRLGADLVAAGFTRFDSAPTYGSAYAHFALDRLAQQTGAVLTVDTKYGQLNERNPRGLAKKILRAPSPGAFAAALWQHSTADRMADAFWQPARMIDAFDRARRDLQHTAPGVFYFHAPPRPVLGPDTAAISEYIAARGATLGLSDPTPEDLEWLRDHPAQRLTVLVEVETLKRHFDVIRDLGNVDIRVHGVFRHRAPPESGDTVSFRRIVEQFFVGHTQRKFVIGVNSSRSVERLARLASETGSAGLFG